MDNYSLSVGVIVIKDSKVLLVKHNYGSANGKYLNPGGFLKDGELPEEAAAVSYTHLTLPTIYSV